MIGSFITRSTTPTGNQLARCRNKSWRGFVRYLTIYHCRTAKIECSQDKLLFQLVYAQQSRWRRSHFSPPDINKSPRSNRIRRRISLAGQNPVRSVRNRLTRLRKTSCDLQISTSDIPRFLHQTQLSSLLTLVRDASCKNTTLPAREQPYATFIMLSVTTSRQALLSRITPGQRTQ